MHRHVRWMAGMSPKDSAGVFALSALLVAFLSASQDVVIDAYRTDVALPHERGIAAADSRDDWAERAYGLAADRGVVGFDRSRHARRGLRHLRARRLIAQKRICPWFLHESESGVNLQYAFR